MSAGADGGQASEAERGTATIHRSGSTASTATDTDNPVLVDAHEDRWAWRRRLRRTPRTLAVYRVGVAVAGLFFICLGVVTGPLPGPGGIPLVLLGLAIWASEFEWANRLMGVFKAQLKRYRGWSRHRQVLFWVAFAAVCGGIGYTGMALFGVPGWLPDFVELTLRRLPGL